MRIKFTIIMIILFTGVSCQKKIVGTSTSSNTEMVNKIEVDNKKIEEKKELEEEHADEQSCIENKLNKELVLGEMLRKIVANVDFVFCNGTRVRLATYKFSSKKYKAYGFIQSNTGNESCLVGSDSYTNSASLGDQGILEGKNMKLLVGGHKLDVNNKLVVSSSIHSRYVDFENESYGGEMALIEDGKIKCWGVQHEDFYPLNTSKTKRTLRNKRETTSAF